MNNTRRLVRLAVFAAVSFVLMYLQFPPVIPAAPYLKWELSDIPVLVSGFAFGPGAAGVVTLIKGILFLLLKGEDGPIGAIQNVISTLAFVLPASLLYQRLRSRIGSIAGMILGGIAMTLVMIPANLYFAMPLWGIPAEARMATITAAIIPFNLLRAGLSTVVTALVWEVLARTPAVSRIFDLGPTKSR
jgi:riboflavin transporter FmnP